MIAQKGFSHTNLILRPIHLLKHLSHGCTAWLLLWLHPTSGDDPLLRVPTAADQQNLKKKSSSFKNCITHYFYCEIRYVCLHTPLDTDKQDTSGGSAFSFAGAFS